MFLSHPIKTQMSHLYPGFSRFFSIIESSGILRNPPGLFGDDLHRDGVVGLRRFVFLWADEHTPDITRGNDLPGPGGMVTSKWLQLAYGLSICMCIYIYVYIIAYACICNYIYIYIYMHVYVIIYTCVCNLPSALNLDLS